MYKAMYTSVGLCIAMYGRVGLCSSVGLCIAM